MAGWDPRRTGPAPDTRIPIIGQRLVVHGWWPTILAVCGCEQNTERIPIAIVGIGAVGTCPACGAGYRAQQIAMDLATSQVDLIMTRVVAVPAQPPKADA